MRDLYDGMVKPIAEFRKIPCPGQKDSLWEYEGALASTPLWPPTYFRKFSIKEIVEHPRMRNWKCTVPPNSCYACKIHLEGCHIPELLTKARNYWEGLCLDCMNITRRDVDKDYWKHTYKSNDWSRKCRKFHGRNTWYFSFMGRPEIMKKYQLEKANRKKANGYGHWFASDDSY